MAERVAVTGNPDRLRALGFLPVEPDEEPDELPEEPQGESIITARNMSGASIEEKARVITEAWIDGLTDKDIRKMGASGIDKVAKVAGLGGAKRQDPSLNPIMAAIVGALSRIGVQAPPLQIIEPEQSTLESK